MSNETALVDIREFKHEMVNYLYQKLYTLDSRLRVIESTLTFNGDDTTTKFFLASNLRFISAVSVDATSLSYGDDWTFETDSASIDIGKVILNAAPGGGIDNVSVTFGVGIGWIYPDFPRRDLGVNSYPRIAVSVIESPQSGGFGANQHILKNNIRLSIMYIDENSRYLEKMAYTVKNNIVKDARSFYNWRYIRPDSSRPLESSGDGTNMISAFNQDYLIPDRVSITTYN